jgi:hypothetical protein
LPKGIDVKSSDNVVPWGVSEFAEKGADHEIFNYLEHTASPDPADPLLLDRITFFVEDPRQDYLRDFISDLTEKSGRQWQTEDFALRPPRKRSRDDWGDEPEEQTPDQGAINLSRLINEFVGYLRREEEVPFPRGELVRRELSRYFIRRHEGDLDPRPSMLEQALNPKLKLPKPPRPAHPLCPERVTLDVHLAGHDGPHERAVSHRGRPVPGHARLAAFPGVPALDRRRHAQESGGGTAPFARHAAADLGELHRRSDRVSPRPIMACGRGERAPGVHPMRRIGAGKSSYCESSEM